MPNLILGEREPDPVVSNTYPNAPRGRWVKVTIRRADVIDALSELAPSESAPSD